MAYSELTMVCHMNNSILNTIILTVLLSPRYTISMDWRERNTESAELEEPENEFDKVMCTTSFGGLCKNYQDVSDGLMNRFIEKKSNFASQPISSTRCSCQMRKQLMYLGHAYYPSILEERVCIPDSCGPHHRCVEKKYSVKVLKRRDPEVLRPTVFPANLKGAWMPETLNVGVACECVPALS